MAQFSYFTLGLVTPSTCHKVNWSIYTQTHADAGRFSEGLCKWSQVFLRSFHGGLGEVSGFPFVLCKNLLGNPRTQLGMEQSVIFQSYQGTLSGWPAGECFPQANNFAFLRLVPIPSGFPWKGRPLSGVIALTEDHLRNRRCLTMEGIELNPSMNIGIAGLTSGGLGAFLSALALSSLSPCTSACSTSVIRSCTLILGQPPTAS